MLTHSYRSPPRVPPSTLKDRNKYSTNSHYATRYVRRIDDDNGLRNAKEVFCQGRHFGLCCDGCVTMSVFGTSFRVSTFGESHGKAVGVIVDNCPPGLRLTESDIQVQLNRRRPAQSAITTSVRVDYADCVACRIRQGCNFVWRREWRDAWNTHRMHGSQRRPTTWRLCRLSCSAATKSCRLYVSRKVRCARFQRWWSGIRSRDDWKGSVIAAC